MQNIAFIAGAAGLALSALVALFEQTRTDLVRSYLVAYLFFFGIGIGCLAILMLQYLTGGAWGFIIRRLLEAGTRTLPLLLVLFLPLLLGMKSLYVWTDHEHVEHDPVLRQKELYLNIPFFLVRAALGVSVVPRTIDVDGGPRAGLEVIRVGPVGARNGLAEGDVLLAVEGQPVDEAGDLHRILTKELIDRDTDVEVLRAGTVQHLSIRPSRLDG